MTSSEQIFVIRTWLVNSRSYHLATASNSEMCFEMEVQSSGDDIGPECLQSDDSYSLDAFGDLPDFAGMPPRTTECWEQ